MIIGTIVLGLGSGLVLGLCFGMASTLAAFGISLGAAQSGLALLVVTANPLLAIAMCMLPRPDDSRDDVWGLPGGKPLSWF